MSESIFKHKTILGIDSNMDFLDELKETTLNACPECWFDKVVTFRQARQYMAVISYDLVIADIMSSPGYDLLVVIENHDLPVVALLSDKERLGALYHCNGLRIRAIVNRQNLEELVPAIEHVLTLECMPGWKQALKRSGRYLKSFMSWPVPKNLRADIPPCETFFY